MLTNGDNDYNDAAEHAVVQQAGFILTGMFLDCFGEHKSLFVKTNFTFQGEKNLKIFTVLIFKCLEKPKTAKSLTV